MTGRGRPKETSASASGSVRTMGSEGLGGSGWVWVLVSKFKAPRMEMNRKKSARCVFRFELDRPIEPYTDLVQTQGFQGNVGYSSEFDHSSGQP